MALFGSSGKLEKMSIRAFLPQANPVDPPQLSNAPEDTYLIQVNPTSYTRRHVVNYADRQTQGSSGSDAVYNNSEPVNLDFEFLFDATGVIEQPSALGDVPLVGAIASALSGTPEFVVLDQIAKFNHVVYDFRGEEHRPRKVVLVWGPFQFECALTSLSFRFTLFKPDGTPLRAVATCSFREAVSDVQRELQEDRQSPDLTHVRQVKLGDSLPLLAYQIYGDPGLYLEVARVNKLVSFRRLRSGQQLSLPPLDKSARASGSTGRVRG